MNAQSLSRRIWDGKYGWGREGVLYRARERYRKTIPCKDGSAMSAYASALYSIANDPAAAYLLRAVALWRLFHLLTHDLRIFYWGGGVSMRGEWTADQCETMAAILLRLSRLHLIVPNIRADFYEWGQGFVDRGLAAAANEETSAHTLAFLNLHLARVLIRSSPTLAGMLVDQERQLAALTNAEEYASRITDLNQRSRVFRALAEFWGARFDKTQARFFMDKADEVLGVSATVHAKNALARKHFDL